MKPIRSRLLLVGPVLCFVALSTLRSEPSPAAPSLKSILLDQLRSTHNQEDWFVPVKIAIEGLTPEQANWKDGSDNHSIAQLVNHLVFWNRQYLEKLKGENPAPFKGDNKETFAGSDKASWEASVQQLGEVLTSLEKTIEEADETKVAKWASTIAKISTHNAYHTGQIIYIRKMNGNWNPEKGVK